MTVEVKVKNNPKKRMLIYFEIFFLQLLFFIAKWVEPSSKGNQIFLNREGKCTSNSVFVY